jgi:hypothetical protein
MPILWRAHSCNSSFLPQLRRQANLDFALAAAFSYGNSINQKKKDLRVLVAKEKGGLWFTV